MNIKKEAQDGSVTFTASPAGAEEHMFSPQKHVLHLVLALFFLVWWDLCGVWILPLLCYVVLLLLPLPFGGWNFSTRMEVRSVVILFFTLVSIQALIVWCVLRGGRFVLALLGVYVAWYTFLDDAPKRGGRFCPALRQRTFWRHIAAYFPMSLTRTAELDPKRNYIFGYHPHGIISVGALCNFATEATSFSRLFPGIDLRLLTLAINFRVPFFREYLLGMGINDASRESCCRNLTRGPGASVMLVVGGARESLATKPGQADLVLEHRKGFVKIALVTGASLVPVFSFGENDIFGVYHNATIANLQLAMQKRMGFAIPLFFGRALTGGLLHRVFGLNVGVMPLRMPVHSVVGRPIHVEKVEKPTQEQIDAVHAQYVEELKRVYKEWRDSWSTAREVALEKGDSRRKAILKDSRFQLDHQGSLEFLD